MDKLQKYCQVYIRSVACLLTLTSVAKIYSATGNVKILTLSEGLLPMSNRQALVLVGCIELAISLYLFCGKSGLVKLVCIAWLSGNFVLYRIASALLVIAKPCPCLGVLTEKLPLKPATINGILIGILVYMVCGSAFFLFELRRGGETFYAGRIRENPSH